MSHALRPMGMPTAWFALGLSTCLLSWFAPGEEQSKDASAAVAREIPRLASEEFEVREAASAELLKLGEAALEPLKKSREATGESEVKERITQIRKAILHAHPEKAFKLILEKPEDPVSLNEGGTAFTTKPAFKVWFENASDEPLSAFVPAASRSPAWFELLDTDKKPLCCLRTSSMYSLPWVQFREYFTRLAPGERANALGGKGWRYVIDLPNRDGKGVALKPGRFHLVAHWETQKLVEFMNRIPDLPHDAVPCSLVSEPVPLEIIAPNASDDMKK